ITLFLSVSDARNIALLIRPHFARRTIPSALLPPTNATPDESFAMVNKFLRTELESRSLALALASGVIDEPSRIARFSPQAGRLLAGILRTAGILEGAEKSLRLSEDFLNALAYRDLLEAR